jgi:hypothetical protein
MRLEKMYLLLGRSHFSFSCSFYIKGKSKENPEKGIPKGTLDFPKIFENCTSEVKKK